MQTNRQAFDAIAPTWYGVRHWPLLRQELEGLAQRWKRGRIANLGCGAGADFIPFVSGFHLVGLDFSRGMLREGARHNARHDVNASLVQGELTQLPFRSESFDYAIGVACYHHIPGESGRVEAYSELKRILKPAGEAFVSVWNHDQPRFRALPQDQLVPWRVGEVTVQRYYHLYVAKNWRRRCSSRVWNS